MQLYYVKLMPRPAHNEFSFLKVPAFLPVKELLNNGQRLSVNFNALLTGTLLYERCN